MRILQSEFVCNCDKMGDNKFRQVKRNDNVALYERKDMENNFIGYEVFKIKTVLAGAKLPGGKQVEESYEVYPGAKAFGKNAYFVSSLNRAEVLFDQITNEVLNKEVKNSNSKENVVIPNGKLTMKMLISLTNLNQAKLHPIVKQWEQDNLIKKVSIQKSENGRGRPSAVYEKL